MTHPLPVPHQPGRTAPVLAYTPLVLPIPHRAIDLHLRVSAPATGDALPILLLSHGHGPSHFVSSLYGYGPVADFYAARGFAVCQPTHLDSATLGLRDAPDPEAPLYWRSRAEDMSALLDRLDRIEAAVPHLSGRLDHERVAVLGHSMGGHTASLLLGARTTDPVSGTPVDLADARIRAGVLLAAPGRGGDALTPFSAEHYPVFRDTDFSTMTAPALVVAGEKDEAAHLSVAGPDWHRDPFELAPAPKSMLTVSGAEHGLGGIAGYDLAETTDEDPDRVAALLELTAAYLRSQLVPGDPAWHLAVEALRTSQRPVGVVESRPEALAS